jgi:hypothetical protein
MRGAEGTLKARDFLFYCEEQALAILGPERTPPHRRVMWTILQLHYGEPAIHFELQPQPSRGLVEVGLHFESSPWANDAWAAAAACRAAEFMAALGPGWELEAWTASWRRLHRVHRFERLTAALARAVAGDLARAIAVLGPFVQDGIPATPSVLLEPAATA